MYGSYGCGACAAQKALFGSAFKNVTYVECHSSGVNSNPELCAAKGIRVVPTWEIDGQFYMGLHPLDDLAEISGFTGAAP